MSYQLCKENDYSENILGGGGILKRYKTNQSQIRSQAERMALEYANTKLAADIMKMAMKSFDRINNSKEKDNIRILLQVHDELVFEVREALYILWKILKMIWRMFLSYLIM